MLSFVLLGSLLFCGDGEGAGEQALKQASALRRESFGTEGEEKHGILTRAAEAYRKVAADYATQPSVLAEAWFRCGEIERSLGHVEEARGSFTNSAGVTKAPNFAARALNELGHLERRLKDYDKALSHYQQVEQRFPDERQEGVRAMTWRGKVLILQKKVTEGHQVLLDSRTAYPDHPVDVIRNLDTVGQAWLKDGRRTEAEALVAQCLATFEEAAQGPGKAARDVARALSGMKVRAALDKAGKSGTGG